MNIVTSCMRHIRSCSSSRTRGGLAREMKVYALTITLTYIYFVRRNHAYDHRNKEPNDFTCHYDGLS